MTRDELITTLAKLVAGLQAPISMFSNSGVLLLGAGDEPARELMGLMPGWTTPAEFEELFRSILEETT